MPPGEPSRRPPTASEDKACGTPGAAGIAVAGFAVAAMTPAPANRKNAAQAIQPPVPRFCQGPVAASTFRLAPNALMLYMVINVSSRPTAATAATAQPIARFFR